MRYSSQPKVNPQRHPAKLSNLEFFQRVAHTCNADRGTAAILLVGARDLRSIQVRRAQAPLRYDRRSSYFSHAAVIAKWDPEKPERSSGLEATLDPTDGALVVPERNGVTKFQLKRYLDGSTFPNLAFIALDLKSTNVVEDAKTTAISGPARKRNMIDAARNPLRARELYPLWDTFGTWAKYRYNPEQTSNPLLEGISLPAAAYCEYVYASAQIDITPGAMNRQTCPEMLWSTFLRWQEGLLATSVERIVIHQIIRDEYGIALEPLSMEIKG